MTTRQNGEDDGDGNDDTSRSLERESLRADISRERNSDLWPPLHISREINSNLERESATMAAREDDGGGRQLLPERISSDRNSILERESRAKWTGNNDDDGDKNPQRSTKRKKREKMEAAAPSVRVGLEYEVALLREALVGHQKTITELCAELEEERAAAASATDEAMSMILRLQREKAAAQMEARQFKREAEERMHHDQELIADLEEVIAIRDQTVLVLSKQLQAYHENQYPPLRCDEDTPGQRQSTRDLDRRMEDLERDQEIEKEVVLVMDCPSNSPDREREIERLYQRLEALEADRESMRREIVSMSTNKAQIVLLREIAQNLYRDGFSTSQSRERESLRPKMEKSLLFSIPEWVLSFVPQKHKGQRNKRIGGTGRGCSGGLSQVLEKPSPCHHLHVQQRTCCFSRTNHVPPPPRLGQFSFNPPLPC